MKDNNDNTNANANPSYASTDQSISLLFINATIITINKQREIIRNGYIQIKNNRINLIGKCPIPESLAVQVAIEESHTIDCKGKIIIPGLVNTHAHLIQSLLRGLAEDLSLHDWLCDVIWPLEAG